MICKTMKNKSHARSLFHAKLHATISTSCIFRPTSVHLRFCGNLSSMLCFSWICLTVLCRSACSFCWICFCTTILSSMSWLTSPSTEHPFRPILSLSSLWASISSIFLCDCWNWLCGITDEAFDFDGTPLLARACSVFSMNNWLDWATLILGTYLSIKSFSSTSPSITRMVGSKLPMTRSDGIVGCINALRGSHELFQRLCAVGHEALLGPRTIIVRLRRLSLMVSEAFGHDLVLWRLLEQIRLGQDPLLFVPTLFGFSFALDELLEAPGVGRVRVHRFHFGNRLSVELLLGLLVDHHAATVVSDVRQDAAANLRTILLIHVWKDWVCWVWSDWV